MQDESQLLARFVSSRDEEAFGQIVSRHFDLVYSTALRQLNHDAHLAEDVAQSVFTDLARKARWLSRHTVLAGWLYQGTRFAAAKAVRTEQRRRTREQEALRMQELNDDAPMEWDRLRPVLDAAMSKLSAADRNAVLLHYFERQDFRTVGLALGLSSDAAQKRVSRALLKLRGILKQSRVAPSVSVLAVILGTNTLQAAPIGLAATVAKTSLATAAAFGPLGTGQVLIHTLSSAKAQLVAGAAALFLLGGVAFHSAYHPNVINHRQFKPLNLSRQYNGRLDTGWTPAYGADNNLAGLGPGRHVFNGVPFEIGGVIQLQGKVFRERGYRFPEAVNGIRVGSAARKIHLLHANSGFADPPETPLAKLVLHYSDGGEGEVVIRQQVHVLDWWEWRKAPVKTTDDPNTFIAWRGRNAAAEPQGASVRLFATAFDNSQPQKTIKTIDYVSAMTNGAPFLVGLTMEY